MSVHKFWKMDKPGIFKYVLSGCIYSSSSLSRQPSIQERWFLDQQMLGNHQILQGDLTSQRRKLLQIASIGDNKEQFSVRTSL